MWSMEHKTKPLVLLRPDELINLGRSKRFSFRISLFVFLILDQ